MVYDVKADRYLSYMLVGGGGERRHIEYSESERLEGGWSEDNAHSGAEFRKTMRSAKSATVPSEQSFTICLVFPITTFISVSVGVLYVIEDIVNTVPGQAAVDGPIDAQLRLQPRRCELATL